MKSQTSKTLILPRKLRFGDTVAVIRPSSRIEKSRFEETIKQIRALGFCVVTYTGKRSSDSVFAASDRERAEEFDWAFREPGIRGVFACRGGYGAERMLYELERIKNHFGSYTPKIFVGYSDATYIHQWLQNKFRLRTFHGPLVGHLDRRSLRHLFSSITEMAETATTEVWNEVTLLNSKSQATGRLVGGNLSLLRVAGDAALPREKIILALEDTFENYYRLDRMIWALIEAGYSEFVQGILLGRLNQCGRDDAKTFKLSRFYHSLEILTQGPIWTKCRFGHGMSTQRLLPLGAKVSLSGRRISFEAQVDSR